MVHLPIDALPDAPDTAWVFPGQGAQHVGMGADLAARSPEASAVFEAADTALGFPLSRLCFDGPEEELVRTVNTQPALVAHGLAALAAALASGAVTGRPAFVAGHSLGEYAALIVAGAVSFEDGMRLVRERGRLMQEACDAEPGTMAAVLGLEPDVLRAICEAHGASLCNVNAPGNITIGGRTSAVEAAGEAAQQAGATRVVPLAVSGAFHTPLMQSAADGMREVLAGVPFADPTIPVVSNVTAAPLTRGSGLAAELADQVTSPVLWADSVRTILDAGVTTVVEFGPGRVLTGLIRRIDRSATTRNIGTADDVTEPQPSTSTEATS
ncbi:MAG: ACP S-malonyltransferase [Dehalococcoidia bacterium]|nr:ACP S-malonyltransferase [Dehalococcoidia bacterium]